MSKMSMRMKRFFVIGLLSAASALFVAGCGNEINHQQAVNQAQTLVEQGHYKKAVITLKKQLQENAELAEVRFLLGKIYIILGDGASGEKELKKAQSLGIKAAEVKPYLARTYLLQTQFKKLLAEIKVDATETTDIKAQILYLRGEAFLNESNYKQAETLFMESAKTAPDYVEPLIGMAKLELGKKNFKKTASFLRKAKAIAENNIEANIISGMLAYAKGDLANAEKAYSEALNALPEEMTEQGFRAITGLVTALILQGKIAPAENKLVNLRKSVPRHPYPKYLMAWLKFQKRELDQANTMLLELQKTLPGHMPSIFLLGATNYALQNYEQANVYLTQFINAIPTHLQARKLLSLTRLKLHQPGKALEVLEEVSEKDTELLILAGQAAASIGNAETQLLYLKKAVEAEPDNVSVRAELAKVYMQQGLMQEAINELESIKSGKDELQKNVLLVYAHLRAGTFKKAREITQQMLGQNPFEPKLLALSGIVELTAGQRTKAQQYFNNAIKQDKKYFPAYIYLGRMELEDGNLTAANKFFEQVLLINETSTSAMLGLAQIAERRGEREQVIVWLERAREANVKAVLPRIILARYYLNRRNGTKALDIASELNTLMPNEYDSLLLLGRAQLLTRKLEQADASFERLIELHPDSAAAQIGLAQVRYGQKKFEQAKALLKTAIKTEPSSLLAKNILINLELQTKNKAAALTLAKEIQAQHSGKEIGYRIEGDIQMLSGDYVSAQKAYQHAYSKQPNPALVIKMGQAYTRAGQTKEALARLTKGLGQHPQHPGIRIALASLYQQQGNYQAAERHYQKILSQEPSNVAVLNNMAILLTDRAPEKALTYAKQAYELAPQSIAIADTLGWLFINQGQLTEGVQLLSEALKKRQEPTIQYHLAVGLHKLGEKDQAIAQLRAVVNSEADFAEKAKARALLSQLEQG